MASNAQRTVNSIKGSAASLLHRIHLAKNNVPDGREVSWSDWKHQQDAFIGWATNIINTRTEFFNELHSRWSDREELPEWVQNERTRCALG